MKKKTKAPAARPTMPGAGGAAPSICGASFSQWPLGCSMEPYTVPWMCLPGQPTCAMRQLPSGPKPGGTAPARPPAAPAPPSAPSSPAGGVTVSDIAHFAPAAAGVQTEPHGWALVGVPTNFIAHADVTVTTATLLGESAQVRFTPAAYRWDYGDGTTATLAVPGKTWQQRGQAELTATPTSHVYRDRGTAAGSLQVIYTAQYRYLGEEWQAVDGTVTGPPAPFTLAVVVERTNLVGAG